MQKLPKDRAVKAARTNAILKGRKQVIQESLHTSYFIPSWLINPSPVLNKTNLRPVR